MSGFYTYSTNNLQSGVDWPILEEGVDPVAFGHNHNFPDKTMSDGTEKSSGDVYKADKNARDSGRQVPMFMINSEKGVEGYMPNGKTSQDGEFRWWDSVNDMPDDRVW